MFNDELISLIEYLINFEKREKMKVSDETKVHHFLQFIRKEIT